MNGLVALTLLLLVFAVVVFLSLREFWTWYWKQSEQVELLKRIADSLERLETRQQAAAAGTTWKSPSGWSPAPPPPAPKGVLDRVAARIG